MTRLLECMGCGKLYRGEQPTDPIFDPGYGVCDECEEQAARLVEPHMKSARRLIGGSLRTPQNIEAWKGMTEEEQNRVAAHAIEKGILTWRIVPGAEKIG